MPLPLRIFEERYKTMMRDLEDEGSTFGVVAIREGVEAFGPAWPHRIGTLAQLRRVEPRDDGGYDLLVVGASRFLVLETSTERPYLTAAVRYLPEETGPPDECERLAAAVGTAFTQYADRLRRLAARPRAGFDLPRDPELLGYVVAAALRVERAHKQRLLEAPTTAARLNGCLRLLHRELALLDRMLTRREAEKVTIFPN